MRPGFWCLPGTFNQGPSVTLWAGVSPDDFPTLVITEQQVGHNQTSPGKQVLVGSVDNHSSASTDNGHADGRARGTASDP